MTYSRWTKNLAASRLQVRTGRQILRQKRNVVFGQGELLGALMLKLRYAERPLRSCELAQNILAASGVDIRDRRAVSDVTRGERSACEKIGKTGQ